MLKRLLASRFRISTQLYLGIGGAVALTAAASLVGWFSFSRVSDAQVRVNEGSVPELEAAFEIAEYSGTLVAAGPSLTAAATPEEFDSLFVEVDAERTAFEELLAQLEGGSSDDERFKRIRGYADNLVSNIDAIKSDRAELFGLTQRSLALRTELEELRNRLDRVVVLAIDDQLFYTMTGYRDLGKPPLPRSEHLSEDEVGRYRRLAELQADANIATQLMASAFILSNAALVEPLRERFEAAFGRIDRNLSALKDSPLGAQLAPVFAQLSELGLAEGSGFDLVERELTLTERQQDLLARNRDIAVVLVGEVDGLVSSASSSVNEATLASTQAILLGRVLLLVIGAISVGGAVLIAWLYVGRVLLNRLERLSNRMRRMAGGDLEAEVEIAGRDEVADMAAALEVFRRHALEVQRLNLVERLANELQEKNDQLEIVLADLQRAQDQIVMREKLAALGELTAGVAHEIRNPLNFVKNFSEVSGELIEELHEVIEEGGENGLTGEEQDLIKEISQDISDNLTRIRSHGDRANQIVHDMLMMGRDSSVSQLTDINKLLEEHARLAYHSARATDPNFQLELKHDLDPDIGEIEVVPQELGRVFLNMVGNACDATDEKREAVAKTGDGNDYVPTVWLLTRREEDRIEVRIKDNGNGMPPDVIEKIFNPFFTTKPTDRGTGLGLAISSDIVRKHGGAIRADSEPGQFTEMVVQLPLAPPSTSMEGETDGLDA